MRRNDPAPRHAGGVDLVIFDCDGVLVDSEVLASRAVAEALAAVGYPLAAETIAERFVGISDKDMYAVLESEMGRPLPAGFDADMRRRAALLFDEALQPMPGIEATLTAMSVAKCVASSSLPQSVLDKLRRTGLSPWFAPEAVFSTASVARGKPAPDIFLLAAERLGAAPPRCVIVEDSPLGIAAAKAAGMKPFGFTGGSHCRAGHAVRLAAAGADRVFSNMRELPRLIVGLQS
jgi:HAD superfamily hydrolase (TIGR01509 family)